GTEAHPPDPSREQIAEANACRPKQPRSSEEERQQKAKRNADAYTAFVPLGAVSTGLFLVGTGFTAYHGYLLAKAECTSHLMGAASDMYDRIFTKSGDLNQDFQKHAGKVPGLSGMLEDLEEKAEEKNQSAQQTFDEAQGHADAERKKQRKIVMATGIAAGAGLAGMIIFYSAARITKHRGLMLYGPHRRPTAQLEFTPLLGPQLNGLEFSLRF